MSVNKKSLLEKIDSDAKSISPMSNEPDKETEIGLNIYDEEEKRIRLKGIQQDIDERKKYAKYVFLYLFLWSTALFVFIYLNGFDIINVSDKIIITLLTSTTIKVLGLAYLVINYLFPKNK